MFRNREIRRLAVWFAGVTIVCSGAGFALQPGAGLLLLAAAAAYGAAFFLFTRARYRSIAKISEQINQVLHDGDCLYIGEMDEGELSILQTEISKMTLRIREQNDALKKEKGHLADSLADIAHQLRTPLTSANLILSLLKDNPGESGRKGLLRDMEGLFRQMDRLIDSLLKLSRLDAGIVVFRKEPVQVAGLIETASRPLLIPMELHEITLEIQVPEGARIDGDPDWLGEALQNILKNCMESVGDRGCIQIACEDTLLYTEITIHDSGPGFGKEDLYHVFDRFYRGRDTKASGYGIGLSLCRTIITRQGGTVAARNHPRGGALFVIRFPK